MESKKNGFIRSLSQPQFEIPINYDFNQKNQGNAEEMEILKIIEESLNVETAKKNFSKNNYYSRDDLLLKTKENSVIHFLNSLQNKNISELLMPYQKYLNIKIQ